MRDKSFSRQCFFLLLVGIIGSISGFGWARKMAAEQGVEQVVGDFSRDGLAGWRTKIFDGETRYRLVDEDGRIVLKAVSEATASCLIKEIEFQPAKYRYLRWSWKIDKTIKGGDETTKAGDDYAARIYVVFPGRFFWQTRAINYIWANKLPRDAFVANAFTSQAMMIAVESGPALAGQWLSEERDIWQDYQRLFGEEPDKAAAIAIMTDTDNTGESAVAWYGNIILATSPK